MFPPHYALSQSTTARGGLVACGIGTQTVRGDAMSVSSPDRRGTNGVS